MKSVVKLLFSIMIICSVLLVILQCATTRQSSGSRAALIADQVSIEKQFSDYMFYRKSIKIENIYAMLYPEYRKQVSYDTFKSLPAVAASGLIAYNIQSIDVDGNRAKVWFSEHLQIPGVPTRIIRANEFRSWIKIKNNWYIELPKPEEYRTRSTPMICGSNPPDNGPTPSATQTPDIIPVCGQ